MRTVVLGAVPDELAALIERRARIGADLHDEVWEGEYHMAPAPHSAHGLLDAEIAVVLTPMARAVGLFSSGPCNIGEPGDYRVPDWVLHRTNPTGVWIPSAALVVEIVSPDDESWAKLDFYAGHAIDEVVMADHHTSSLTWLARAGTDRFDEVDRSELLGVTVADVQASITWPS